MGVVADRCPNLELLVLRHHTPCSRVAPGLEQLEFIQQFSNLVILYLSCHLEDDVVPPFSKMVNLRELVLETPISVNSALCEVIGKEISNSVKFLSLRMLQAEAAEVILQHVQLTVFRIRATGVSFNRFRDAFPVRRSNPQTMFVKTGVGCFNLLNGVASSNPPSFFHTMFLSC